jgi:hypothetical protein
VRAAATTSSDSTTISLRPPCWLPDGLPPSCFGMGNSRLRDFAQMPMYRKFTCRAEAWSNGARVRRCEVVRETAAGAAREDKEQACCGPADTSLARDPTGAGIGENPSGHLAPSEKRRNNDPAPAVQGKVRMYSVTREDVRCQVRVMTMDGLAKFGATQKKRDPKPARTRATDLLV